MSDNYFNKIILALLIKLCFLLNFFLRTMHITSNIYCNLRLISVILENPAALPHFKLTTLFPLPVCVANLVSSNLNRLLARENDNFLLLTIYTNSESYARNATTHTYMHTYI